MTENRYTLNQQRLINNKGDLTSCINGVYDWYNNEKLDWYEVVDRLNEQDEYIQELEELNTQLCNFNLHIILDKKNKKINQLKQEMLRLYNYFEDWFEDIIPPDAFSEMWDNVKENKKWGIDE